jgi:hypothetical protein
MRRIGLLLIGAALATNLGAGCPLGASTTTVQFVNTAAFPVEVQLFYGDSQLAGKTALENLGTVRNLTVAAGATTSFSVNCDDLQAIFIKRAAQMVIGNLGPDRETDVLSDGSDFFCGDTITYTFTGSVLLIDFAVSSSVSN